MTSTVAVRTLAREVDPGTFADITDKEIASVDLDPRGGFLVRAAADLTADEARLVRIRCLTADPDAETLMRQAWAAWQSNQAYLAVAAPTTAQAAAQVAALTRQMQGLIRLAVPID